jgi:hypothetical protein
MGVKCLCCAAVYSIPQLAVVAPEQLPIVIAALQTYSHNQGRLQAEEALQAAQAAAQQNADAAALTAHVDAVLGILRNTCPSCNIEWSDFDGCCALTCGWCQTKFCAHCSRIEEKSDALHEHIRVCEENPEPGFFFTSAARLKQTRNARWAAGVRDYLNTSVPPAAHAGVLEQCNGRILETGVVI